MSTVRDLIKASLRLIGASATGETPSADEQQDAFSSLNRMLDRWSTEGLNIYAITREEFSLTGGTGSYTIGSSGTFNTSRPVEIVAATIELQSSTPTVETPVEIISAIEWAEITVKDLQGIPTKLYAEGTYPLETLNLWPTPNTTDKLVLYSKKSLTAFATVSTTVSLPPGYEDALVYNLAMRLAPEYGILIDAALAIEASESKENIKRKNIQPRFLSADSALTSKRRFNILTGE